MVMTRRRKSTWHTQSESRNDRDTDEASEHSTDMLSCQHAGRFHVLTSENREDQNGTEHLGTTNKQTAEQARARTTLTARRTPSRETAKCSKPKHTPRKAGLTPKQRHRSAKPHPMIKTS